MSDGTSPRAIRSPIKNVISGSLVIHNASGGETLDTPSASKL